MSCAFRHTLASPSAHLVEYRRALGPPLLGLNQATCLLVALGARLERKTEPSSTVAPARQVADGNGTLQERKALADVAAHLTESPGKVDKENGDVVAERPTLPLYKRDGATEQGHRLGWAAGSNQSVAIVLGDEYQLRMERAETHVGHARGG